jgi:hypothetical protein
MAKPPAFQLYAKDWLSSSTRIRMTRADRGLFWDMAAFAWDSETPGTIDLPLKDFAKLLGISLKVLRKFLERFPKAFIEIDGKLSQPKLAEQFEELLERKRKQSDAAKQTNAARWGKTSPSDSPSACSASASASASATKDFKSSEMLPVENAQQVDLNQEIEELARAKGSF